MEQREILFRGKRIDNNEWVEGYYLVRAEKHLICSRGDIQLYEVDKSTVGQFTGLTDKEGVRIFEGDLIKSEQHNPSTYEVMFLEGAFCANYDGGWPIDLNHFYPSVGCQIDVIGNIHEA